MHRTMRELLRMARRQHQIAVAGQVVVLVIWCAVAASLIYTAHQEP